MSDGPRRHHYLFAHRELPSAAFRFGADLVAAGREGRLTLDNVWHRLGETLPEADRLPSDGLRVDHRQVGAHDVLLVTLPVPQQPAEAHFTAIAVPPAAAGIRYFTLEEARSPIDGRRYTVLAEWTHDGKHINYGDGPDPRPAAFTEAIIPHLVDAPG
jgi:hypothetical protein